MKVLFASQSTQVAIQAKKRFIENKNKISDEFITASENISNICNISISLS